MKKNIMIISITLIGFILAAGGNLWAANYGSGPHPKWDKPSYSGNRPDHGRSFVPGNTPDRPVHELTPRIHKPYPNRAPYRFAPKYRPWLRRPFFRPFRPKGFFGPRHHAEVNEINNYYSDTERYSVPEDEFNASATISDTGFSVSVGVRDTN